MKKFFLVLVLILVVLVTIIVLYNRNEFMKYKSLQDNGTRDLLTRIVSPYYQSCLTLPKKLDDLIIFSTSEGYYNCDILKHYTNKSHIQIDADSIYIFINVDETDSILDNPILLESSTFWDYYLFKKDIILFVGCKLSYCELHIDQPKYRKDDIFEEDSIMFNTFYKELSFLLEKQAPQDMHRPYSNRKKLLVVADLFQDSIAYRNIIPCDAFKEAKKIEKIEALVIEVLSNYRLEKEVYNEAIIPISIVEETIN